MNAIKILFVHHTKILIDMILRNLKNSNSKVIFHYFYAKYQCLAANYQIAFFTAAFIFSIPIFAVSRASIS